MNAINFTNTKNLQQLLSKGYAETAFAMATQNGVELDYLKNKEQSLNAFLIKVSYITKSEFEVHGWGGRETTRYALMSLDHIPEESHPAGYANYGEDHGYTTYWDLNQKGYRNMKNITKFEPICMLGIGVDWNKDTFTRKDITNIARNIHAPKPVKSIQTWGESQARAWGIAKDLEKAPN